MRAGHTHLRPEYFFAGLLGEVCRLGNGKADHTPVIEYCDYSAYRILQLSPCDKIAQNRVL